MRLRTDRLLVLAATMALASSGCSMLKKSSNPKNMGELQEKDNLAIVYRTDSDRLNLASSGLTHVQQASYHQPPASALPPVSISTLNVKYPHPTGRKDLAQVYVAITPAGRNSAKQSESFVAQLTGFGNSSEIRQEPIEVWTLDIPKWQVDGIIAKLQKANFFRRSKIISSNSYLAVSLDGEGFGKNYRNVDELDALILRVRQQGRPADPHGRPLLVRRPAPPRSPALHDRARAPRQAMPSQFQPNYQRANYNDPAIPHQTAPQYQQARYQAQHDARRSGPPTNSYHENRPGYQAVPGYQPTTPMPWANQESPGGPGYGQRGQQHDGTAEPNMNHNAETWQR